MLYQHALFMIPGRYDPVCKRLSRWLFFGFTGLIFLAELAFALTLAYPDPGCYRHHDLFSCEAEEHYLDGSQGCEWDDGHTHCEYMEPEGAAAASRDFGPRLVFANV